MKKLIGNVIAGGVGGVLSFGIMNYYFADPTVLVVEQKTNTENPVLLTSSDATTLSAAAPVDFSAAADRSLNSVVHIRSEYPSTGNYVVNPFYEQFFGPAPRRDGMVESMGSGVILSSDGYIVTNNHVIEEAKKITVTMNNNRSYEAKLIGSDAGTDIAVLKIEGRDLPAISIGNSEDLRVGEWVLAVGNPFNLTSTVTAGIVSAKSRNINVLTGNPDENVFPIESFIQTDAAVNPGNSGGALVNSKGELVGINTAIASSTGSFAGYSFAVPVNLVQKVTSDLIKFGVVQRGFLGVNIKDIDQKLADQLGMIDPVGVYVGGLVPGGAAEKGGIKTGDIILKIGDADVNTVPQLQEHVGMFRPGDAVKVKLKRGKEERLTEVVLLNSEGTTKVVKKEEIKTTAALGLNLVDPNTAEKTKLNLKGGAKISSLDNQRFRAAGIKPGFIVTKFDQIEVKNPEHLQELLEKKKGMVAIEGLYPNGMKAYYSFGL